MGPAAAALVAATLAASQAGDRILVCRALTSGDPALARGEAVAAASREAGERILDYGVPCESTGEAARAARRAGLGHAILVTAEGRTEGSLFELTVVDAEGRVVAVRRLALPPGTEASGALASSLDALASELRRPETRRVQRRAAIGIAGGGAALLAAGAVLAGVARADADRANAATTPEDYVGAKGSWERSRTLSGVALGLGSAVLAAGIVWRVDLQGEE